MALLENLRDRVHLLSDAPLYRHNPTFTNPLWEKAPFRALILRLSPFRDVQKSSTHLFLFREVRSAVPNSYIDMAFLPNAEDRSALKKAGAPLILGVQSLRGLPDFSIVLVSISCVPELVNLPFMLRESGIPLWAAARDESLPPIILGGSSVSAAHGILRDGGDCMADALFFGEGEGAVGRIASLWAAGAGTAPRVLHASSTTVGGKQASATRGAPAAAPPGGKRARLSAIADAVPGLWPAGDGKRLVRRASAPEGTGGFEGITFPILPGQEAGTAQLPITRGCPCFCSFCFEGHERKPFRQIPFDEVSRAALDLKGISGAETLEVSSFNFNTHERIVDILLKTNGLFARVNAMSQRADILASSPDLLEAEMASGKRGYTIGVEGVSEALRRFLHKSLEERQLKAVVEMLHARRARELKLFYILTGREEEADFKELSGFIRWLSDLRRNEDRGPRVIFSFGLLVRMPFTPLRHDGLVLDAELWRNLIQKAKSACAAGGFEFRLAAGVGDTLLIQALALGDTWTVELVEELAARGVVYDLKFPPKAEETLASWIARHGAKLSAEKPEAHRFPLPFLESPEERALMYAQFLKAKKRLDDGYCRRGDPESCGRDAARQKCACCTLLSRAGGSEARPTLTAPAASAFFKNAASRPLKGPAARLADAVAAKSRLKPLLVGVEIPMEWASPDGTWLAAVLLRGLCGLGQRENVLAAREVTVTPWLGGGFRGFWFGRGTASITAWDPDALALCLENAESRAYGPGPEASPRFFTLARKDESFASLRLAVELPRRLFPRAEEDLAAALEGMHAPFTARGEDAWYRMIVSPKALGKKIIFGGRYRRGTDAFILELVAGPRLDVPALFRMFPGGGAGIVLSVREYSQ